jgi:hypothetical protein
LGPVGHADEKFSFDPLCAPHKSSSPGAAPWLFTVKPNVLQLRPAAVPLPGLATLLQAVSEDLFLTIFRADDILSQGIILKDIAKFLGSASGFEFIQNNAAVVHLQKKEVAHLPFGCYCVPLFFERDSKAGAWAHAWALPHIDKSNVSDKVVPVRTTDALLAHNLEYCESKTGVWKDRADYLTSFKVSLTSESD